MYDLLLSADLMVADPDAAADVLIRRLGILGHANWRQAFPNHAYVAHFLRVHKSLAVAPTRIELQGHVEITAPPADPFFPAYLSSLIAYQGPHRPIKTHATVLTTSDVDATMSLLQRRGVPFRIAPRDEAMPFDRIWVGVTPEDPQYRPDFDGGLCIEIIGTSPLQMPPETFGDVVPEPHGLPPGGMVRVTGRGYLVRDLDATLRTLSANLAWEPAGPVESLSEEGYRLARMGFLVRHSATVDLIEPLRWNSDAGYYLNTWGPGPYYMRIAVAGLDAKAQDLTERSTRYRDIPATSDLARRVQVLPDDIDGALVEFTEHVR
jgi:hypothetical protein